MVGLRHGAGRLAGNRSADAVAHRLVGLPVAAGGEGIAVRPVLRVPFGIPAVAAHAGDERRTDAIALDGERVIRIGDVDVLDPGEHAVDVRRARGRGRETVENRSPHGLPGQAQPVDDRGGVAADRSGRGRRSEGVRFTDGEVGRPHRLDDLVRDAGLTDIAERGGQTAGDRAVPAVEQAGQQVRSVVHQGERRPPIDRILLEEPGAAGDQRGGRAEGPHPVDLDDVVGGGQRGADFEQGRAVQQGSDLVASPRRADEKLPRHRSIARMQQQGLLGRQAPRLAEAGVQVAGAESPERGVPRRGVSRAPVRRGGDVPALDDRQQEPVPDEPLAVRPWEIRGTHGDDAALLQGPQGVQGTGQLLRRRGHPDVLPSAFGAARILAFRASAGGADRPLTPTLPVAASRGRRRSRRRPPSRPRRRPGTVCGPAAR